MNQIFSFTGARKIIFGCGSFDRMAEYVAELNGKRPLVVMDNVLSRNGFREKISALFDAEGMRYSMFDSVEGEPPLELADEAADVALKGKADSVIGIGGGSAMDVAKAAAVVATNKGTAKKFLGLNKIPGPGLPKIMVPTTAGTGSEVTFTSVFIRRELNKKEGMNSPFLYPEVALLDPMLTLTVPPAVTATTGGDAFCHAFESYTSIIANPMSEMISLEAMRLIAANLRTCVHDGSNIEAREKMLMGSLYAGLGLANAGVTAVHSLSYPLGGKYGVSHGLANTILLPAVMKFNLPGAIEKFANVAEVMGIPVKTMSRREAAYTAVEAVEDLMLDCGVYDSLETLGIERKDFPELAEAAMAVARPLANNPRPVTVEDAIEIYDDAF